ncbi:amino acid adenylation domain-containing protein [Plantactinospora siamensis]|uniref:Amino acid adenylation domain-containing protein n=1 Tax=Plantactinospora siamensis TaxID=555372 RepID=A0ABV6P5V0_9ACTN
MGSAATRSAPPALDAVCRAAASGPDAAGSRAGTLLQVALAVAAGALARTDSVPVAARVGAGPWRRRDVDLASCRTLADAVRAAEGAAVVEVSGPAAGVAGVAWTDDGTPGSLTVRLGVDAPAAGRPGPVADMLCRVAEQVLADPDRPLSRVDLLGAADRARLAGWAGRDTAVPPVGAAELFARQARAHPAATALVYRDHEVSYADLEAQVDRLARHLVGLGVRPEVLVAVAVPRSVELVVALLAVLRAGGAYLPLDVTYPTERLGFMLDDARPPILLTTAANAVHPAWHDRPIRLVRLDDEGDSAAIDASASHPVSAGGGAPGDPMYVIYTSGSTGRPKGVVVTHAGVASLAATQAAAVGAGPGDRVLQWASVSFDAAFWDLSLALFAGATLVLADDDDLLPGPPLAETLTKHRITHATLPPAAVTALPEVPLLVGGTLISTGDVCTPAIVRRWGRRTRVINGYGPTETTVGATITGPLRPGGKLSVGRPFVNARIHLLDHLLRPVPPGASGEICIGGPGVARGYLNRPELTRERFLPDPFGPPGGRLYRSGDLGVWDDDGELHFLGRVDNQVKIRGFRIELGEVEAALRRHPAVDQAVAVARNEDPADRYVAAYVNPAPGARLDGAELRQHLRAALPEHMLPAAITVLDAFPVTPNGKIDRAALPDPLPATSADAPGSDRERLLCGLFAEVLGLASVGPRDNFFACGGHSIAAVRLVSRIRAELGADLPVRQVFEHPTPAGIAALLTD